MNNLHKKDIKKETMIQSVLSFCTLRITLQLLGAGVSTLQWYLCLSTVFFIYLEFSIILFCDVNITIPKRYLCATLKYPHLDLLSSFNLVFPSCSEYNGIYMLFSGGFLIPGS